MDSEPLLRAHTVESTSETGLHHSALSSTNVRLSALNELHSLSQTWSPRMNKRGKDPSSLLLCGEDEMRRSI